MTIMNDMRRFSQAGHYGTRGINHRGGTEPLDDNQLRALCPSLFAERPYEDRSERYVYFPSIEIVQGLRQQGFLPFHAIQGNSRIKGKRGFTKHLVRFRRYDWQDRPIVNRHGVSTELLMLNSHDGSTAYKLSLGAFRFVCSNGLMVGDVFAECRVAHAGDRQRQTDKVIEGAFTVISDDEAVENGIEEMAAVRLGEGQQIAFARAARALRYDAATDDEVPPEVILRPRRHADVGNSVWDTMNRAQENLIRGGFDVRRWNTDDRGRVRISRREARPVNGIDQSTAINRGLWVLAEEMRRLAA